MAVWESATRHSARSRYSHPWLAEAIFAFDKWLQRRHGVIEYSAHPQCVFRMEVSGARRQLQLRDGTLLRPGQRVVHLHFWNERIPPVPDVGTTIRWARQMQHGMAVSLRELAKYLASWPELRDIAMIWTDVPCGTRSQAHQLAHIMAYYGFETILDEAPLRLGERLHRFGDNILISLMVLAQNSVTLRADTLRRVRVPIYLSRRGLEERFGDAKDAVEVRGAV